MNATCKRSIWEGKQEVIEGALRRANGNIDALPEFDQHVYRSFRKLNLTSVSDVSFQKIVKLFCRLEEFSISSFALKAPSLQSLQECTYLQSLSISFNRHMNDQVLEAIAPLQLTSLNISLCDQITDKGIQIISENFKRLKTLNIRFCSITDIAFVSIAKLANLEQLSLSGTMLSSQISWDVLSTLPNLQQLDLHSCKELDKDNLQALRNKKPDLQIIMPSLMKGPPPLPFLQTSVTLPGILFPFPPLLPPIAALPAVPPAVLPTYNLAG